MTAGDELADLLAGPALDAAPRLLGWTLLVGGSGGVIVETEAYEPGDPACHAYGGETPRNRVMFGGAGHAYVYRSYGLHWMLNLVCREPGEAAAVLVRALAPTVGRAAMRARRPPGRTGRPVGDRDLCRGPGRLAQALAIDATLDGAALDAAPFRWFAPDPHAPPPPVVAGPRVGLTRGVEAPWRFAWAGSPWVSAPAPGAIRPEVDLSSAP